MAKPDCDDGFVMIALELFAIIARYKMPDTERLVLSEVLLACYGPRKDRACHIDLPTLEHYTGVHRNNLRRAVNGLVRRNMISRVGDGGFAPVKDYERWRPAPDGAEMTYGLSAPSRFGPQKKKAGRGTDHRISGCPNPDRLTQNGLPQSRQIDPERFTSISVDSGERLCQGLGIEEARAGAPEEDLRLEIRDTPLGPPTGGAVCVGDGCAPRRQTRTRRPAKLSISEKVAILAARLAERDAQRSKEAGG